MRGHLVIDTAVLPLALCGWRAQYSPTVLMAVGKVEEPFQGSLASSIISECASLGSAPGSLSSTGGQGHLQLPEDRNR